MNRNSYLFFLLVFSFSSSSSSCVMILSVIVLGYYSLSVILKVLECFLLISIIHTTIPTMSQKKMVKKKKEKGSFD